MLSGLQLFPEVGGEIGGLLSTLLASVVKKPPPQVQTVVLFLNCHVKAGSTLTRFELCFSSSLLLPCFGTTEGR